MKTILICLILGLTLSYNPQAAITYGNTYCRKYNPQYSSYAHSGGDCANFVSQCLHAGGLDFSGCAHVNRQGMIPGCTSLQNCLRSKYGWKKYTTRPPNYQPGYPIFRISHAHTLLVVGFQGNKLLIDAHTTDKCQAPIDEKDLVYYYP